MGAAAMRHLHLLPSIAAGGEVFDNCRDGCTVQKQADELESVNGYGKDSHNNQPSDYLDRKKKICSPWKATGLMPMPSNASGHGERGASEEFE